MLPWTDDAKTYSADFGDVGSQVEVDEDDEDAGAGPPGLQPRTRGRRLHHLADGGPAGTCCQRSPTGSWAPRPKPTGCTSRSGNTPCATWSGGMAAGAVCDRLRGNGANHASPSNLRNWIRARTIRPDSDEDFAAIFRTTGLEHRAAEFVASAVAINSAHRSAGFKIRKLLIAKVRKADLRKMRASGKMEFRLEELSNDASMTAYRIERILPDMVHARLHELNDVFTLEAD